MVEDVLVVERIAERSRQRATRWLVLAGVAFALAAAFGYQARAAGRPGLLLLVPALSAVTLFGLREYYASRARAESAEGIRLRMAVAASLGVTAAAPDAAAILDSIERMTRDRPVLRSAPIRAILGARDVTGG